MQPAPDHWIPKLTVGQAGEAFIADWLIATHGAKLVAYYDFGPKTGTRLQNGGDRPALPDLDVFMGQNRFWLEAKCFHGPDWNLKFECWSHGTDHFEEYLEVERVTLAPVFICVLERDSGELLVAPISDLTSGWKCLCQSCRRFYGTWPQSSRSASPCKDTCAAPNTKCGNYWRRDAMRVWHRFEGAELEEIRAKVKWPVKRQRQLNSEGRTHDGQG